ncbi:MAG: Energy-dependent translational throttle protein EttA [Sodalis sp.]|nr:MAG: Energy-dependent translational throttle protein EttA [Sodalis sp.]
MYCWKTGYAAARRTTNYLDTEPVACIERFLHNYAGIVVAITHDRYFWMMSPTGSWSWAVVRESLERQLFVLAGTKRSAPGTRSLIRDSVAQIHQKELEWVRSNAKGRQLKGKVSLALFEELNNVEYQKRNETSELLILLEPRLGDKVLEVSQLRNPTVTDLLIDGLSFSLPKGGDSRHHRPQLRR